MVLAPRDISGRSTGSRNPGQLDEHEERAFAGIGYDDLLSSTAGWGGSVKPESDTDRPNPVPTTPFEFDNDEDYVLRMLVRRKRAYLTGMQGAVKLQGPGASLVVLRGTFARTGTRERIRESRDTLRGLEAIHEGRGPIGPPGIEPVPNVFPSQYHFWRTAASKSRGHKPEYWFAQDH